jgi:hypothetical protein
MNALADADARFEPLPVRRSTGTDRLVELAGGTEAAAAVCIAGQERQLQDVPSCTDEAVR